MSGEAMTKRQIAEQNFLDGYNCTQAVVAAFADELGVYKDTLIKIASCAKLVGDMADIIERYIAQK